LLPLLAPPAGTERYWWLEVVGGGALLGGCLLVFERRIARGRLDLARAGFLMRFGQRSTMRNRK
jgi:hypothetical protein